MSGYLSLFLHALAQVLNIALTLYMWIIIVRALLSWVNPDPYNPIVRFVHNATEPVLYRIRSKLPFDLGGVDVSPIVVFLVIIFLQKFVAGSLSGLAKTLIYR